MATLKRRHFFQAAGSTLAAIGLSQLDVRRQGDRYARALAQPTSRKLALLVGVNQYVGGVTPLRGCLTDVRMQKELLVHRFGFNPANILTLENQAATRQNLIDAFESHLIDQAQPGDVVVFHFSGHGSLVRGEVKFWLGGLSSQSLAAFESGAIFSVVDGNGNEIGQVEQTRRVGLEGYGTLADSAREQIAAGQLLRERVRGVPTDLTLRVGLDASLGADVETARSQLAAFNHIQPVAVDGRAKAPTICWGE